MKKIIIAAVAVILASLLVLSASAELFRPYPQWMDSDLDGTPDSTKEKYPKIEVKKGTPKLDGVIDDLYLKNGTVKLDNWAKYSQNMADYDADCHVVTYFLWDEGTLYVCAQVFDEDITSIGAEELYHWSKPDLAHCPWINDNVEVVLERIDGSCGCRVFCDAYGIMPFVGEYRVYMPDIVNEAAEDLNPEYEAWWLGENVGAMWWLNCDVHPAVPDSTLTYCWWNNAASIPKRTTSGGAAITTSRESKFATKQNRDSYVIEMALDIPEVDKGFEIMTSIFANDILPVGVDDSFNARLNDTTSHWLVMVDDGSSDPTGNTPTGGKTDPTGGKTDPTGNTPTGGKDDPKTDPKTDNPRTGDIFSVVALIAVASAACFVFAKKKKF